MKLTVSPTVDNYRRFFIPETSVRDDAFRLVWLGTNALFLSSKSTSLLIDPYFSRLPGLLDLSVLYRKVKPDLVRIRQCLKLSDINDVSAILLTHTHIDHALDARTVAGLTNAGTLYTPPLLFHKLLNNDIHINCRLLTDGLAFTDGDFAIRVSKGSHMPFSLPTARLEQWVNRRQHKPGHLSFAWQYTTDAVYNFHITAEGRTVFMMGSAGLPSASVNGLKADILILSVGGLDLLSHRYCDRLLCQTVDVLKPEAVWLSHWDDFTRPLHKPLHWLKQANRVVDYIITRNRAKGIATYLLPPGQACYI